MSNASGMSNNESELLNVSTVSNDSAKDGKPKRLPQRKLKLNRRGLHLSNMYVEDSPDTSEESGESSNAVPCEVKPEKKIIPLTYANGGIGKFWKKGSKANDKAVSDKGSASTSSSTATTSSSNVATASSSSGATTSRSVYVTERNVTVNVENVNVEVEPPKKKHKPITWP